MATRPRLLLPAPTPRPSRAEEGRVIDVELDGLDGVALIRLSFNDRAGRHEAFNSPPPRSKPVASANFKSRCPRTRTRPLRWRSRA